MIPRLSAALAAGLVAVAPLPAEERVDHDMNRRLRREALEHSSVMESLHVLADVHGPRLTGSPNYKAAADWAVEQLTDWGLANARLEPWDFGHPGWSNERASAYMVAPATDALTVEVIAWTPGTNGTVRGKAVHLVLPDRPTAEQLTTSLDSMKGKVEGKVVLVGKGSAEPGAFAAPSTGRDTATPWPRHDLLDPAPWADWPPRHAGPLDDRLDGPAQLTANQIYERVDAFLVANGALVRANDAGREPGRIRPFAKGTFDVAKAVPSVAMHDEHFGRIVRLLAGGRAVELEFAIVNRSYPDTVTWNVVAEIPGTDKADEVVMLGAHLDSWHSATGAADNAIGCAVVMEAVRLLQAVRAKPRRTVRIALWSAEEQGLLGSRAYVKEHFGTFEAPKPGHAKLVAYVNLDAGPGCPRGARVFGPSAAAIAVRAALAPFVAPGVTEALGSASRRLGGTDDTSFNAAGLPGIDIILDRPQAFIHTWHTNLDTYGRIVPEHGMESATAIAAAVYHLATRAEMLPRFSKEEMPAPAARTPESPPKDDVAARSPRRSEGSRRGAHGRPPLGNAGARIQPSVAACRLCT